jgi:hypothetical protein
VSRRCNKHWPSKRQQRCSTAIRTVSSPVLIFGPAEVQRSEISTHGKGAVMAELVGVRVAMLEQE